MAEADVTVHLTSDDDRSPGDLADDFHTWLGIVWDEPHTAVPGPIGGMRLVGTDGPA